MWPISVFFVVLLMTYRSYLFLLGIVVSIIGMLTSRGLMSIGMIILVANAVIDTQLPKHFKRLLQQPTFLALTGVFLVYAVSGLWSENTDYLIHKLRIKLPFLLLPLAFVAAPPLPRKVYQGLLAFFLLLITGTSIGVLVNFGLHYQEIVEQYLHAKTIPTPFNHIRYSLMCVLSIGFGYHLYREKVSFRWSWERYLYGGSALFLFVFLHVLSVRSGLAALYVVIGYFVVRYIWLSGRWKQGIAILAGLVMLPVLAYLFVPTFHNKMTYMARDMRVFLSGDDISEFSDSRRFTSMQGALQVGAQQPLIGVGIGDLKDEMAAWYTDHVPSLSTEEQLLPHSQLLFVFAATGIVGLLVFGFCLIYPVVYQKSYFHLPFGTVAVALWVSFLVEATIEIQLGTSLFLTFWLLTQKATQLDGLRESVTAS